MSFLLKISRINAFERNSLRQLPRVSWTEKKSDDSVSEKKSGVESRMLIEIRKIKLSYFVHVLRKERSCLEKYNKAQRRVMDISEDEEHDGRAISQNGLV